MLGPQHLALAVMLNYNQDDESTNDLWMDCLRLLPQLQHNMLRKALLGLLSLLSEHNYDRYAPDAMHQHVDGGCGGWRLIPFSLNSILTQTLSPLPFNI